MPATQALASEFTVATVNTHWGAMLHEAGALDPVAKADIVLLQEVIEPARDLPAERLRHWGFELVHVTGAFGLAILRRSGSELRVVPGSLASHRLLRMDRMEYRLMQRWAQRPHGFTEHGMISAVFATTTGRQVTVADVHPSMPLKPLARARQIYILGGLLGRREYAGPLILGGDMNHYPRPGYVDERFGAATGLTRADIGAAPTWFVHGTNQEKYIRRLAQLLGQPLSDYDAQLDAVLYRGEGLALLSAAIVEVASDHRAITTRFSLVTQDAPAVASAPGG